MPSYRVLWEIDIDADSPRVAAEKAFEYMQLPGTTANAFDVFAQDGAPCHVDLSDDDEEPSHDDSVKYCPDCEKPNQFGELCADCTHEREVADVQGLRN